MNTIEVCDQKMVHSEKTERIKKILPDEQILFELADFFKVFGDSTRIKILFLLSKEELCVCDIADILGMNSTAISHQLRNLKFSHLVKYRKEGKNVFYSLDDEHVESIFNQGMEHIKERM